MHYPSKLLYTFLLLSTPILNSVSAQEAGGIGVNVQGFSTVDGTPAAATPTPAPVAGNDGVGASPVGPVSSADDAAPGGVLGVDGGSSSEDSSSISKEGETSSKEKATSTSSADTSIQTNDSESCSGDCCDNSCSSDSKDGGYEYGGCHGSGCGQVGSYDCGAYDWYCDPSYGYSHGYSQSQCSDYESSCSEETVKTVIIKQKIIKTKTLHVTRTMVETKTKTSTITETSTATVRETRTKTEVVPTTVHVTATETAVATKTQIKAVTETATRTSIELVPTTVVKERVVTKVETDVVTDTETETATKTQKEIRTVVETSVHEVPTTVVSQWVTTKVVDKTKLVESTVVSTTVYKATVTNEVTKTEVVDSQQTSDNYNNYDCTQYITVCESKSYGHGWSRESCRTYKSYCDANYGYSSTGCYQSYCGHRGKEAQHRSSDNSEYDYASDDSTMSYNASGSYSYGSYNGKGIGMAASSPPGCKDCKSSKDDSSDSSSYDYKVKRAHQNLKHSFHS